jgi:NAD(P)-dependent dehydrogenase (short-subunit alcohol dehydrogenase family)
VKAIMPVTKPLHGKIAVVAGATRGAGRGIACMLGEAGATVYCTGRSIRGNPSTRGRPETIDETAQMTAEHGGTAIAVQVDHTVPEQVAALFKRVESEAGRLDILVNNVNGDDLYEWKPFWKQSLERGFRALDRGVQSHLLTIHEALPLMIKTGGSIIGITDQGGGTFFYGFVKQSVMKMAEIMAPELIPHNITMVSLTPGFLRSEAVLEHYGVTESNWRDAAKKDPYFACSETPFFIGRAVAALAADPRAILKTGSLLTSGALAEEYGFTDVDGSRPSVEKGFAPLLEAGWKKLVAAVHTEFRKHGVDPSTTLEEDQKTMTFKARLSEGERAQWLKEVVGPPGVAHGNPEKIAAKFYERFERLRG